MYNNLSQRKATMQDVKTIIALLVEDELGKSRENLTEELDKTYIDAFNKINIDSNQYLMVVEMGQEIVGTCHLTMMPSLTFKGSTRMQIEAVRVAEKYRGQNIGEWMMKEVLEYGKLRGAKLIQLTTNKKRERSKKFYETLGFQATHEGMKLHY
jgi:ribosomal protein S18 acetylase RimI-like enzyme